MGRRPNARNEFLLDVYPCNIGDKSVVSIYNLTRFLDSRNGIPRKQYLERVEHTIRGNKNTIYIIDHHKLLNAEMARKLASDWYLGKLQRYDFND